MRHPNEPTSAAANGVAPMASRDGCDAVPDSVGSGAGVLIQNYSFLAHLFKSMCGLNLRRRTRAFPLQWND
jgi:hypothetical protein